LAGAEYFPLKWLSIGAQVKGLFSAKIRSVDDGQERLSLDRFNDVAVIEKEPLNGPNIPFQPDFGGVRFGVMTRVYF
jgi:hypothetical protein